ncbi:expressed unknown protein [Seminavis robusta]|uniref:RING-type domain-containing protein n=1 Tax=Seminavis robusta TaxID=568900 RepID=A0A9N8HG78_9STRA|nr:expressed unknown protein [Seminavis robusta]|eukprot:Sro385_g131770.1 n/a (226) ;mRNA; f:65551-66408
MSGEIPILSDDEYLPVDYQHKGHTEDTVYVEIEDRDGDAYYDDEEEMHVVGLVAIIFVCGLFLTGVLFFVLVRHDRRNREQKRAQLEAVRGGSTRMSSARSMQAGSQRLSSSAASQIKSGQDRVDQIEQGLVVQTWMAEVHPEEAKTDEDDPASADQHNYYSSRDSCPICKRGFDTGDMVCSSRSDKCRHSFHKTCMFNWLQYQTACPVCNEEYLVPPTTGEHAA